MPLKKANVDEHSRQENMFTVEYFTGYHKCKITSSMPYGTKSHQHLRNCIKDVFINYVSKIRPKRKHFFFETDFLQGEDVDISTDMEHFCYLSFNLNSLSELKGCRYQECGRCIICKGGVTEIQERAVL